MVHVEREGSRERIDVSALAAMGRARSRGDDRLWRECAVSPEAGILAGLADGR
jgi:hypothetical protein